MAAILGNTYKVILESSNGEVYDLTGMVTEITIENNIDSPTVMRFEILSNSGFSISNSEAWDIKVNRMRTSKEWRCEHCGAPNPREEGFCTRCGAIRSFLYD